jgi:transposase-like protein
LENGEKPGDMPEERRGSDDIIRPPRSGSRWTDEERMELIRLVHQGRTWAEIAEALGRSATSVMYEFARLVVDGDFVDIEPKFSKEDPYVPPMSTPPPNPEQNFGTEPGDTYDVIRRRDKSIWYSFKRVNKTRNPFSKEKYHEPGDGE